MREKEEAPMVETIPEPAPVITPPAAVAAPEATPAAKSSWGGVIAILLIVGLIVTAAFYSWGERLATQSATTNVTTE